MKVRVNAKEANAIPILEVARLVVPRFQDKGHLSTGQCCRHTDEKLGNLRFKVDANFAHCFTCDTTWWPVGLVKDFCNLSFQDALEFLYSHFPSYFSNVKEYEKKPKWRGLSNKEYKYLGVSIQQNIGNMVMDIREFATCFPDEHDALLIAKILKKQKEIDRLADFLRGRINPEKIQQDKAKMEDRLYDLLTKGLMNKKNNIFSKT